MRLIGLLPAWIATFYLASPALAWNAAGHRIAAAITYDHLTPKARARVDGLLERHPDYATILTRDAPADAVGRARAAFLTASTWPDLIRSDPRFYDDTRQNAQPTQILPGFPTMARHTNWHYKDIPFSTDGTSLERATSPNALTELQRIIRTLDQATPYDIPWLLHLESDVHQPLHCTSRFLKSQPHGDQGGNGVIVVPGRTLHGLWDDAGGSDASDGYVNTFAAEITTEYVKQHGPDPGLSKDPKKWIDQGFRLARRAVYTFGEETGSREHPLLLPEGYEANARRIARTQLAVAGFRLAQILNKKFE